MSQPATLWQVDDGVIVIRPMQPADAPALIAGRDEAFHRWFGPGSDDPQPTACITRAGEVIGWVDGEADQPWLGEGEVNVGYNVFAAHRRRGYATRAVSLLMHRLALEGVYGRASVLIERENRGSIVVAERAGFGGLEHREGNVYLARQVPALHYGDGMVSIRRQEPADVNAHVSGIDEAQIRWMWQPGEREQWTSMSDGERRAHSRAWLTRCRDAFGTGPKWTFAVDSSDTNYVGFVGLDLANPDVPPGEANLSYSSHPAHRGRGYVSRAVHLALRFLAEHTGCRVAHLLIEEGNAASIRVARSVGARASGTFVNGQGQSMRRFLLHTA